MVLHSTGAIGAMYDRTDRKIDSEIDTKAGIIDSEFKVAAPK